MPRQPRDPLATATTEGHSTDVSTVNPTLQSGSPPSGPPPPSSRPGRLWPIILSVIVVLLALAAFVAHSVALDEYVLSPGLAQSVGPLVSVPAGSRHAPVGQILLTDVYVTRVTALDWLFYELDPNDRVYTTTELFGAPAPQAVINREEALQMVSSSELARVVALRRLGFSVPERSGAIIVQIAPRSAAAGLGDLAPGDAVLAVDGAPTATTRAAVGAIHAAHPGQRITLTVQHVDGTRTTDSLVLGHSPTQPDQAYAGVGIVDGPYFVLPFRVGIDADGIGGPSAGLAFTLGIINQLTSGTLTGGHRVAATGTVDLEGRVGTVGGVPQKTIAVRQAGATVFLVPPGNYQDALSKAGGHLDVIPVATVDQALTALERIGGHVPPLAPMGA